MSTITQRERVNCTEGSVSATTGCGDHGWLLLRKVPRRLGSGRAVSSMRLGLRLIRFAACRHGLSRRGRSRSARRRPLLAPSRLPSRRVCPGRSGERTSRSRFVDSVESWVPTFFPVQGLIVHHTVTANDDPDPAATVRAIYHHHVLPPHQHPRQRRQSMDRWPVRVATRLRTHPPSLEGPAYRSAAETPNPATPHRAPAHIGCGLWG